MYIKEIVDEKPSSCRYIINMNGKTPPRFCMNIRDKNYVFCKHHLKSIRKPPHDEITGNGINNQFNMKLGRDIQNYLYTGDKKLINYLDNNYINILDDIYFLIKNSGFIRYEKGKDSKPDMIIKDNDVDIPLEIKTSVNKNINIKPQQIHNHMVELDIGYCYLIEITPYTLKKFNENKNISYILRGYYSDLN